MRLVSRAGLFLALGLEARDWMGRGLPSEQVVRIWNRGSLFVFLVETIYEPRGRGRFLGGSDPDFEGAGTKIRFGRPRFWGVPLKIQVLAI